LLHNGTQNFCRVSAPLYYRDKIVLVAFGGSKKEPSDKVKELNFIAKWKLHFYDISSHDHIFVNETPQTLL
jgi:hypothetical protein